MILNHAFINPERGALVNKPQPRFLAQSMTKEEQVKHECLMYTTETEDCFVFEMLVSHTFILT